MFSVFMSNIFTVAYKTRGITTPLCGFWTYGWYAAIDVNFYQ